MSMTHEDLTALAYLVPATVGALVMKAGSGRLAVFSFCVLPGTLTHELLHLLVGAMTGAKPVSMNLFPTRQPDGRIALGSVTFENLRWFNAAPTCLAPLLGLPVVWLIAKARVAEAWSFEQWDLLIWAGLSAQLLSCWPSSTDLVQSLRSWPLYLAGVSLAMMHYL